ncbi:maltokinase N-terminal cap-like domain-containing protein [Brevibacterium spongiae]|uniref:Maltokinase n=1 Tax=Brevibacterium spongiae TaxID=2909672 RepID=A0ABY5SR55_9MICO|nr:hypothetical protein [Brevibacterium spongiae]UVI35658.1 hypothetical protein L1F31_16300 [Brevibacterium spongiae]
MAISSELEQLLASWIPRQPWFPKLAADFGTDPDITPMSVARAFTYTAEELGGFVGLVTVISVGDGPTLRRLNIPLTLRGAEDMHLRHALIGRVDDLALGTVYVYDGAADPVFVNLMADAITKRKIFDGGQLSTESLRHSQEKSDARDRASVPFPVTANGESASANGSTNTGAEAVPPKPSKGDLEVGENDVLPVEIRPIEVADSGPHKSTIIIHDEYEPMELSFFRVLENGMPSSLTIPVLLTEAGSRSVPEVIGWGSGRWYDMFEVQEMEAPMALLSHVDVDAEPAWREAVNTVCAVDSGSIGAYNAHAAEMGRRIGELHADMAAEFGIVEGAGVPTKQLVQKWVERIDWALGRAPLALDSLVPELRTHRARVQSLETIGTLQKIHGELTLDHVVSSSTDGYSVVKFTDSTNSDPKPAAFDLVALLRSIDYAAGFARLQRTDALDSEDGSLVVSGFGNDPAALRAIFDSPEYLWASQVQNSLLSGYSRARGDSIGLNDPVLRAALIDRLLVEVVTELRNRPNWLSVPLATLTLVLKGKPARAEEAPAESASAEDVPAWARSSEPTAADDSSTDDAAASAEGTATDAGTVAGRESASGSADLDDSFAVAAPADERTAADSESVAAAPRGTSGTVAAAIANSGAEDNPDTEDSDTENSDETSAAEPEADEVEVADTAENTVEAVTDPDIDDVEDSTVVPPQDDDLEAAPAEDEEFIEEEEPEVPVRRVPASFAARGAAAEDSDSTDRESQPTKPKDAPKLGKTWSERSQESSGDRGTFGEPLSERSDKSREGSAGQPGTSTGQPDTSSSRTDTSANRSDTSSDRSGDDSKPAGGSVFDDLLGTERKRNRMKKRKKD